MSQGRDKSCILMSLVKSNKKRQPGDLLSDWRRINVAITRAKHKLILVGCAETLAVIPFFEEVLSAAAHDGWLVRLPTFAWCSSHIPSKSYYDTLVNNMFLENILLSSMLEKAKGMRWRRQRWNCFREVDLMDLDKPSTRHNYIGMWPIRMPPSSRLEHF